MSQAKDYPSGVTRPEIDKVIKTDVAVVGDWKQSLPAITLSAEKTLHREWKRFLRGIPPARTGEGNREGYSPKEGPLLMGEVTNVVTGSYS